MTADRPATEPQYRPRRERDEAAEAAQRAAPLRCPCPDHVGPENAHPLSACDGSCYNDPANCLHTERATRRPQTGIARSSDGRSAAEITAEPRRCVLGIKGCWSEHTLHFDATGGRIEAEAAQGAAPRPHEHHWVGPDNFSPVDYCGICSVPRPHQHHVHDKRRVTDCPECIEAATAFLSEGTAPRAKGLPYCQLCGANPVSEDHALETQRRWKALTSGAAPRAEGLDVERLAKALRDVVSTPGFYSGRARESELGRKARAIAVEYARLSKRRDEERTK